MDQNFTQELATWVLGIFTTLFGGLNIFQWFTLRSLKRIKTAEADKAEIQNLKDVIETIQSSMKSEIDRLRARVEEAEKRADEAEKRADEAEKRASENVHKYLSLCQKHDDLRKEFEDYKLAHK